jgi:hypothetical protein
MISLFSETARLIFMQRQSKDMQCPSCGYDGIADDACFCSHCRYQFREPETEAIFEQIPSPRLQHPAEYRLSDSSTRQRTRRLEVMLIQPAVLLMIFFTVVFYVSLGRIAELTFSVASLEVRYGGFVCLLAGTILAWIFYRLMLMRIE